MFWAITASGSTRVPTINAAEVLKFMLMRLSGKTALENRREFRVPAGFSV
jgi:hypothetical protein